MFEDILFNMSRSFYVDSLIVKEPIAISKSVSAARISTENRISTLSSPIKASPTSNISALHPVPCYPRHHSDFLNLCCPLCIPTAQTAQIYADRAMKQMLPTPTTTSTLNLSSTISSLPETQSQHSAFHPEGKSQIKQQPSTVSSEHLSLGRSEPLTSNHQSPSSLTEQRRIRYGNIGKNIYLIFCL